MFRNKNKKSKNRNKNKNSGNGGNKVALDLQYLALAGSGFLEKGVGKGKKSKSSLSYNSSYYDSVNPLSLGQCLFAPKYGDISEKDSKYLSKIKVPDRHSENVSIKLQSVLDFSLRTNTLNVMTSKISKFLEYRNAGTKEKKELTNNLQLLFAPKIGLKNNGLSYTGSYVNPGKLSYVNNLLR